MEVKELLITSILGSGGAVGLAFYFIKKYVDQKMKKADDESQKKQEIKTRRMEVDDKLHHAYGRCLFWLRYHVEKGIKPNGEINEAFQELQEAEEEKKKLDREIIAGQESD